MPVIDLPNVNQDSTPTGSIEIWSGTITSIPSGWALCDGVSGRPDLLDRFVRGVNTAVTDPGQTGGLNTVTLTLAQISSHSHSVTGGGTHDHTIPKGNSSGSTGVRVGSGRNAGNGLDLGDESNPIVTGGGFSGFVGGNQSHTNIPPFFEVAYIIKEN